MNHSKNFPFNLNKGERDEVGYLFTRNDNPHIGWLRDQIAAGSKDVNAFAQYGLEHLTKELDLKLSDFFFVLSSISDIPKDAQDFFTAVMVFCEAQHVTFTSPEEIRARYENVVAPTLTQLGAV